MAKAKASKKRGNFIVRYFREASIELRKVNWPTRQEATRLTMIVLIVVAVMSTFLAVLDYLYAMFFRYLFTG